MNEIAYNGYIFSSDKSRIDTGYVHRYLADRSYWARGIPLETVITSLENSYCAGVYTEGRQAGFGRLITDYATFGYLADVFIDESHRGKGLGKRLVRFILGSQMTVGMRRIMLGTKDAHDLYLRFGFAALKNPHAFMEIHRPDVYRQNQRENG